MTWVCSVCRRQMRKPKFMAYTAAQIKPKMRKGNWVLGFSLFDKRFYVETVIEVFCSVECFSASVHEWLRDHAKKPWSKK